MMIGIAYCGASGKATLVQDSVLAAVTCGRCKKTVPDELRFRRAPTPFTLGSGRLVHGGNLHQPLDMIRQLEDVATQARWVVRDLTSLAAITSIVKEEKALAEGILEAERLAVQERLEAEAAAEAKRLAEAEQEVERLEAEAAAEAKRLAEAEQEELEEAR